MSHRTTDLGPRVQVTLDGTNDSALTARLDISSGVLKVRAVTTAPAVAAIEDNEILLMKQTASAASLAIRSGNTVYIFDSTDVTAS